MASAGAAAMAKEAAVESSMSDDTEETGMAEAVGAACAVSPSVTPTPASGEGCVASVPVVDVAAAVASPATLRRMYERKEDMCPAVGGTVVIGTGSAPTSTAVLAEAAVAVAPATASAVASREGEAARIVAVEVTGTVTSPAASEGTVEKWEAELPPLPASR